jgi:hypothetical protein
MFVTVNVKITVHAEFVGMFTKYRHMKFHVLVSWPIVPDSGDGEDDCGEADGM